MTDLEITRLCAEAMFDALEWEQRLFDYDPLHDDAQAMALVKKFNLFNNHIFISKDISREICECVAKMQAAR